MSQTMLRMTAVELLEQYRDGSLSPVEVATAMLDQVTHHFLGNGGGGGEADALPAAVRRKDGGVDADQVAAGINQRAAGVAPVNGRVGLDKVLKGGDAQVAAAGGTDDAHGYCLTHTQRVADGEHHIAHLHRAVTVQLDFG